MKTDSASIQEEVANMVDDTRSSGGLPHSGAPLDAARQRLALALDSARETCVRMQAKTAAGAKAADRVVRDHPRHAIGAAFGLGALIGLLLRGRRPR